MAFNTIPEMLEDIRAGRMVVILDDEDRENEGDLIMAAEKVRPEDINFMVREARGLVCLALTEQRCRQLGLKPMVSDNTSPYHTNFTVSIEAAEGVTTGISAYDRARTVQAAVKADARPRGPDPARPHLPADRPAGRRAAPRRTHRGRVATWPAWPGWSRPACWSRCCTRTAPWRGVRSWRRSRESTA